MAMVVRSNLMAMNANRQLGMNNSSVSKSLEKLSSGFKINRAGDDASGLAISEKMKAQIKGLETASSNSQDGISLVQTAEGALTEVHDMLNRMTELATKSANGTIKTEVDRQAIQSEVNALLDEIDRIAQSTNFNGINLLDGSLSATGPTAAADAPSAGTKATIELDFSTQKFSMGTGTTTKSFQLGNKTIDLTTTIGINTTVTRTLTADELTKIAEEFNKQGPITAGTETYTVEAQGSKLVLTATDAKALTAPTKIGASNNSTTVGFKVGSTTATSATGVKVTATDGTAPDADYVAYKAGDKIEYDLSGLANLNAGESVEIAGIALTEGTHFTVGADIKATVDNIAKAINEDKTISANFKASSSNGKLILKAQSDGAAGSAAMPTVKLNNVAVTGNKLASGGLTLQVGDTNDSFNKVTVNVDDMSSTGLQLKELLYVNNPNTATTGGVLTEDEAGDAIKMIKDAINMVSTNRANLGALQNRLEHTINNLDVAAENLSAANSRIRDTDMAKQMMDYTKMNVLTQSAQAMLAQANQQPQSILQLLQ